MSDLVIDPRILLMMKCKHVMKHFPEWRFSWENEETAHFEGWVNPGAGRNPYQLRLCFNPQNPEVVPELYIWKPIILPSFEGGTINACTGHNTHTLCNGRIIWPIHCFKVSIKELAQVVANLFCDDILFQLLPHTCSIHLVSFDNAVDRAIYWLEKQVFDFHIRFLSIQLFASTCVFHTVSGINRKAR